jgi:DNA-binding transcriptional LysR family regulator
MPSLIACTVFARAYELGSFSSASRELGLTQSTVSKHIATLEAELGVQLFARTTRKLNPTMEAERLYEGVQQLLDAADAITSSVAGPRAEPTGLLRITVPDSYGRAILMPKVARFLARYPRVKMDVRLTDQAVNLVEDGMELGVRIGDLSSSTLVARPIGKAEHLIVATPEYLAAHGEPRNPGELAEHNCVVYSGFAKSHRWIFESEHGRQVVEVSSTLSVNSADAMCGAVLDHVGIGKIPDWIVKDHVASGALRVLLPDHYAPPMPINVIYPQTRVLSVRARHFIDFLLAAQ